VNVIVLLTHVGIDIDVVLGAGLSVNFSFIIVLEKKTNFFFSFSRFARFFVFTFHTFCATQGVDVIIGGDSHTLLSTKEAALKDTFGFPADTEYAYPVHMKVQ
jgi:2',3'-cyclic-nucleotide 2'-phosphodiesterase (5'-nucleotidase family)